MIALTPEEADLMRRGQKIDAIKLVRYRTHLGLVEAKILVERWDGVTIEVTPKKRPCPYCRGTGEVDEDCGASSPEGTRCTLPPEHKGMHEGKDLIGVAVSW